MLIDVVGSLNMDSQNNFQFSQTFVLVPNEGGGYSVMNDIFRLVM